MRFLKVLSEYWFKPAPAERLSVLRILIGGFALAYISIRAPHFLSYGDFDASRFAPVGLAAFLNEPVSKPVVVALIVGCIVSGIGCVAGFYFRVTGPLFAALFLAITTYGNSWGKLFHTENLVVLHLGALCASRSADAFSWDSRRNLREAPSDGIAYGWPIRLMSALTVTTYVLAGVAKLRNTGLAWVTTDFLRNYVAYDNLRKLVLGSIYSPLGGYLVRYGAVFKPFAWSSLLIELGAPLSLLNRKLGRIWVVAAFLFHLGVLLVMAIAFIYPLSGIAYASFFDVENLARHWQRRIGSRRVDELRSAP